MICQFRRLSTQMVTEHAKHTFAEVMSAWQVEKFGGIDQLTFSKSTKIPEVHKPNSVKIKVLASSVNPLDLYMTGKTYLFLLTIVFYFYFERGCKD